MSKSQKIIWGPTLMNCVIYIQNPVVTGGPSVTIASNSSVMQPNLLLHRLMQHHTSCDNMEDGDWMTDQLGSNQQQRVHCLTVGCCTIDHDSNHCTPFCHVMCDVV